MRWAEPFTVKQLHCSLLSARCSKPRARANAGRSPSKRVGLHNAWLVAAHQERSVEPRRTTAGSAGALQLHWRSLGLEEQVQASKSCPFATPRAARF